MWRYKFVNLDFLLLKLDFSSFYRKILQSMGKKVRMKWRKLDVVQQEDRDNLEEVLDNENPFLKVHLLNTILFRSSKYIDNI